MKAVNLVFVSLGLAACGTQSQSDTAARPKARPLTCELSGSQMVDAPALEAVQLSLIEGTHRNQSIIVTLKDGTQSVIKGGKVTYKDNKIAGEWDEGDTQLLVEDQMTEGNFLLFKGTFIFEEDFAFEATCTAPLQARPL